MKPVVGTGKFGFFGAVLVHGLMLTVLFVVEPAEPSTTRRRPPVRVKLLKKSPPPPKPVEIEMKKKEPTPPKPKLAKAKPPKKRKAPKKAPVQPKKPQQVKTARIEPKPTVLPPKPIKPRKFTVSMEATVATGSVAVPTSEVGFAFGTPDGDPDAEPKLLPPDQAGSGKKRAVIRVLPKLVSAPSYTQMRALYPKQALQEGTEANVGLKVLISAAGKVVRVKVTRPAGNGFDKVAASLVRRFRFQPAKEDGQAVAMWIPWTYKFRLDG